MRTYKHVKKKYTPEDLERALEELKRPGSAPVRQVAQRFNIPYETLRGHHTMPASIRRAGRHTAIPYLEEREIALGLIYSAEGGMPIDRPGLVSFVRDYLNSLGRNVDLFVNNTPGKDWVSSTYYTSASILLNLNFRLSYLILLNTYHAKLKLLQIPVLFT